MGGADPLTSLTVLLERVLAGDLPALARAITIVENRLGGYRALLAGVQAGLGRAAVIGFTGPPGAGKSTLVNAFVKEQRRRGRSVAVIAIDPSSPISKGAVLGDRIRMSDLTLDDGVFIRSVASRGRLGGLSPTTSQIVDLMDASGRDLVILETVGAGQSDVEVADLADTTIVVCAPGLGDDVQAIKSGILEIANVFVVNKSDQPEAQRACQQLKSMLHLRQRSSPAVEVVSASAISGQGVVELANAVERHAATTTTAEGRSARRHRCMMRLIVEEAFQLIKARCGRSDALVSALGHAVRCGELDLEAATESLLSAISIR